MTTQQQYQDNKEQIREQRKQYYQDNKERFKQYREDNKEKKKQYYQNNKERFKQYREDNKEHYRLLNKKYRATHRKRLNELTKKRNKEAWHDMSDPYYFKRRVSTIKARAKYRNYDFNLDGEYLKAIWPEDGKCPALGLTMKTGNIRTADPSERDCFPSLDRIDNTKGYVKGNVHWVSLKANRIMSDGTPEEVMKVALFFQQATEERANAG